MAELNLSRRTGHILAWSLILTLMILPGSAFGYIGPGSGIALMSSAFFFVITFFTVLFSLLLWPFRILIGWFRRRKSSRKAMVKRLVILGLDGLDPVIIRELMDQGELPNFSKLAATGTFRELQSTNPPISPVAWSSFMTGCNPGRHSIYDFIARDPKSYLPVLSSTRIHSGGRVLKLGKIKIPLGKPTIRSLRKSKPFWKILGEQGIFSTIIRVPITFPPEKFNGLLLSGMCAPDLLGTQGTFSYYTSGQEQEAETTGGNRYTLEKEGNTLSGFLHGPDNPLSETPKPLQAPFKILLNQKKGITLNLKSQQFILKEGEYSPWIQITFSAGLTTKITGVARFLIVKTAPSFGLYVTPINIDPEKPVLPISHPMTYGVYLAKRQAAPYATLGLAEDTWALNEKVIDDQAFLDQTYLIHEEREKMFFDALDKQKRGLVTCVFDASDRIQHMFWRYRNVSHPALNGKDPGTRANVIPDMYRRMDALLGKTMGLLGKKDELMVMSDHGFNDFSRGFNINSWLHQNGYLTLQEGKEGNRHWLADVNWSQTKAYAIGLSGIYLNIKGRERDGIVLPGKEAKALKEELIAQLSGITDENGSKKTAIKKVWDRMTIYNGPYVNAAPDLIIGFNTGYRSSWDSAQGKVTKDIFKDNTKAWSGDHCFDPDLVPGILFTTMHYDHPVPSIMDIAPTALSMLGVDPPSFMEGKPFKIKPNTKSNA